MSCGITLSFTINRTILTSEKKKKKKKKTSPLKEKVLHQRSESQLSCVCGLLVSKSKPFFGTGQSCLILPLTDTV